MYTKGILKGLVKSYNTNIDRGQYFDLFKFVRDQANRLHIPFFDDCCPDSSDSPNPVRFDSETGALQQFNGTTWVAVDLGVLTANDITLDDGTVSDLALKIGADTNNGFYGISDTQLGIAVEGVLVGGANTLGLFTDAITEQTSGAGIEFTKNTIQQRTAAAINSTATATAAQIAGGLITSTSAAAVALTLPIATDLATQIGAVQGTSVDFIVDNSAGSNTVTVTVNTGITAVTAVLTGGATLTVGAGVAGQFRIYFTSATVAKIARVF